jgi:hypothetical protein
MDALEREPIMRSIVVAVGIVLAFQGVVPRPDSGRTILRPDSIVGRVRRCVPTAPMPIVGLRSRPPEPMPILRPDSATRDSVMVVRLVPCYLVDSDSVKRSRPR